MFGIFSNLPRKLFFVFALIALAPDGYAKKKSSAQWMRLIQQERAKTEGIRRPDSPTSLNAVNTGPREITLHWRPALNDGGSPIIGYRIKVGRNTSWFKDSRVITVAGSALSATISDLRNGARYSISVESITQPGSQLKLFSRPALINHLVKASPRHEAPQPVALGPALAPATAIPPATSTVRKPPTVSHPIASPTPRPENPVVTGNLPGPPFNLQGYPIGTGIYLFWAEPLAEYREIEEDPITGYLIEYSMDEGNYWQQFKSNTRSPSEYIAHIQPNKPYLFRVSAINSSGIGPNSSSVAGDVLACGICDKDDQVTPPPPCTPINLELDIGGIREALSSCPEAIAD